MLLPVENITFTILAKYFFNKGEKFEKTFFVVQNEKLVNVVRKDSFDGLGVFLHSFSFPGFENASGLLILRFPLQIIHKIQCIFDERQRIATTSSDLSMLQKWNVRRSE